MARPTFTLTERDLHLEAVLGACKTLQEVKRQFEELLPLIVERKPERLLIDLRPGATAILSTLDRYAIGLFGQRFAPHVGRVAVVTTPEQIDPKKFGAQVALNRGLTVDVFIDSDEALRWLLSDSRPA